MTTIKRVAVYCGSAPGADSRFADQARATARAMVEAQVDLVYGGGRLGLMGVVADTVLELGGRAYGVIPQALVDIEVAHRGLSELHTVANMHERKARMTDLADAFLALPGGVGTLEEFFEILTWAVLGLHAKPLGLLNVEGYYDPLLKLLDHAVAERFVRPEHRALVVDSDDPEGLARQIVRHVPPPPGPKWIELDQT